MTDVYHAAILGGGPAGCLVARALARAGLDVVLVDPAADSTPGYDMWISAPALDLLNRSGIDLTGSAAVVNPRRLDVHIGSATWRPTIGIGHVVDRQSLGRLLRTAAVEAGVTTLADRVLDARVDDTGVRSVSLAHGAEVAASLVVDARGPQPSVAGADADADGMVASRRFVGVELARDGSAGVVIMVLTPPDPTRRDDSPSRVWLLPNSTGGFTIGVARLRGPTLGVGAAHPSGDELIEYGLQVLATHVPGLSAARPDGEAVTGVINCSFSTNTVETDHVIKIGDAAGLVNPFTGEGLSYALESATLAAQATLDDFPDVESVHAGYCRAAGRHFIGFFETARHASRRYHLAWRVLEASVDTDTPFFVKGRNAVLLPQGAAATVSEAGGDLRREVTAPYTLFFAGCDEVLLSTVRHEWPFLARMSVSGSSLSDRTLRPTVLFAAGLSIDGHAPDPLHVSLGAAIELAWLGLLAFLTAPPRAEPGARHSWATIATVVGGDFLLAQATRLVTIAHPGLSWAFSAWLDEIVLLRSRRLAGAPTTGDTDVEAQDIAASAPIAALFAFPLRVGAHLAGAAPATVAALDELGRHAAQCYLAADEVLALREDRTRLDASLHTLVSARLSDLPVAVLTESGARTQAAARSVATCQAHERHALAITRSLPDNPATELLRHTIETLAAPARATTAPPP